MENRPYKNRDINWLFFNERVLQEAADTTTPLLERLKFLAIFSSNLDEYFKVRISQLRQLKNVDKSLRKRLMTKTNKTLKIILDIVAKQQKQFGETIKTTLSELEKEGIYIRTREDLTQEQKLFLQELFTNAIKEHCNIINIVEQDHVQDSTIYLIAQFSAQKFETVKIPVEEYGRFIPLGGEKHQFIFLDDVLKLFAQELFPDTKILASYTIKMSRDAELYLDDDYTDNDLVDKIYQSLGQRDSGQPTRLLYEKEMPISLVKAIQSALDLADVDMVLGGNHHNLSDFFTFPEIAEKEHLYYKRKPALRHPTLSTSTDLFKTIAFKDQLVHFPYQKFDVVEKFIMQAALDKNVTAIKMSLYRIAKTSVLTDAILKALENGKKVVLFVEAKARFDEENNIHWGKIFQEKGAEVIFSVPNIKVHSKIALVERLVDDVMQRFAYIGTGNFNAKTAKIYCDHGLFTAHKKITLDLAQVFEVLERKLIIPKLKRLLVSPFTTRSTFMQLIQNEMMFAKAGKEARIVAKMNSLEDSHMISALYRASEVGVEVRLIVRGFCCLVPRNTNLLPNEKPIKITSVVDRYLEHGRVYLFENGGNQKMFMGSADWMTRNLDRRIEVLTPILDKDVFAELKAILAIQLTDNVKARILDEADSNLKVQTFEQAADNRSQYAIYEYLKNKLDEKD
ncbi:polyphosphate kinase [Croceivirga lutea]|uniref:polyphosphate kinase 1 n=1 Tax=Croceivirga lutea TaxID=1775167 RepID=UPI00163A7D84|nr:polyphosphate kinase 1 [Croceivirga lutea]GGG45649.1 polyphosphate kinase [Croceivirga lutea]